VTRLAAILLLAAPVALAHDHGEHLEFYRSLTQPGTGMSCCTHEGSQRDCWPTDRWRIKGDRYEVEIDGAWVEVPPAVVLVRNDNPVGRAILCHRGATIYCFLPGVMT